MHSYALTNTNFRNIIIYWNKELRTNRSELMYVESVTAIIYGTECFISIKLSFCLVC